MNTFPGKLEEKKYKFAVFIAYFIMAAGDLDINKGGVRNYEYVKLCQLCCLCHNQ